MNRPRSLDDVFADSDFGMLDVEPAKMIAGPTDKQLPVLTEISQFWRTHGRMPSVDADDVSEMVMAAKWSSVVRSPSQAVRDADVFGLLVAGDGPDPLPNAPSDALQRPASESEPLSLDDILDDDELEVDTSLFKLHHVTPAAQRQQTEHRADFYQCPDFAIFEPKFAEIQRLLDDGERKAVAPKFWSMVDVREGDFFIRNGLLAMVVEKAEMTARSGETDFRLRIVFSNGMESDPLRSSWRKSLSDDKTARQVLRPDGIELDSSYESDEVDITGTIYVARSLSEDPAIAKDRMILHKIGVTSQNVQRRIADAKNDATFLLASVQIVATYSLVNLSRRKLEELLHRFFDSARPESLAVTDRFGKKVYPREWFYVLPEHVSQAVELIRQGVLHEYRYDLMRQKIVMR
jgi:hypothetical protein